MTHIMGAGLDTINVPADQLPVAVQVGLVARITFSSRDQVGADHELRIDFTGPPGILLTATQEFQTPPQAPGVPEHWRTAVSSVVRLPLPIPIHGDYRLQATLDDDPLMLRYVDVRAIEPPHLGQS